MIKNGFPMFNKMNSKLKYILVILANYLLVLYALLTYSMGDPANISYIPFQILLTILNFYTAKKILSLAFLCLNFIISIGLANFLSIYLYYTKISSKWETTMIGVVIFEFGAIIAIALSVFSIIIKAVCLWIDKKNAKEEIEQFKNL